MRIARLLSRLLLGLPAPCLAFGFVSGTVRAAPVSPATQTIFHEAARALPEKSFSLGALLRPARGVVSASREEVHFTEGGSGLVAGYSAWPGVELRGEFHALSVAQSGHSGQFEALSGAKGVLLEHAEVLSLAVFGAVAGMKSMGFTPWYFGRLSFPVSVRVPEASRRLELTLAPRALLGFEKASNFTPGLEAAVQAELLPWLDAVAEWVVNFDDPNPRFPPAVRLSRGASFWAGVALRPAPGFEVPLVAALQPAGGRLGYGLMSVSFQYRGALATASSR